MPIDNAALMNGATGGSVTGGVSLTFTEDGVEIKNGKHVAAPSIADFRLRPSMTFKTRNSAMNADRTWSKEKRWMTFTQPRLLDDGVTYGYELVRIEVETYPDISATERTTLLLNGAQMLTDADFDSFRNSGSLA